MHFLRVEVVLQAATYFIVFTDADNIPPTIRLDNYSEVPLQFHQVCLNCVLSTKMDLREIGFGDVDWILWAQDRD
jgi:vacuolar protein sorting-associated protein 13D